MPTPKPGTQVFTLTQTLTGGGYSVPINVSQFTALMLLVNVTAVSGTTPSMTIGIDVNDDVIAGVGNKYDVADAAAITAITQKAVFMGPGTANPAPLSPWITLHWFISGTTPSFTFTVTLIAS
jgi:hypothetical protein